MITDFSVAVTLIAVGALRAVVLGFLGAVPVEIGVLAEVDALIISSFIITILFSCVHVFMCSCHHTNNITDLIPRRPQSLRPV